MSNETISDPDYARARLIESLLEEHGEDGWDGDSAPALSKEVIENALRLLKRLPADLPEPEFAVEPDDGSLAMEWYGGYRKVASLSLNASPRFAFSALNGTSVTQGVYRLDGASLSPTVLSSIREIFN